MLTLTRSWTVTWAALAGLGWAGSIDAQEPTLPTTVVLVRHAERSESGRDPRLTSAGRARAEGLAHVLGDLPVTAIYSTQFARTRLTAEPLAELKGLEVLVMLARETYVQDMVQQIQKHQGETIVVVSHSNTVPAIINTLGVTPAPVISENDYDDLFILTIDPDGAVRMLSLRYGAPTP